VNTTAASAAIRRPPMARVEHHLRRLAVGGSVFAIASLLWFGFPIRRRRTMIWLGLMLIATLLGAGTGCSGKNASAPSASPGTTPGAYIVTVTGSSGAITASTAVTVTLN
jgi:hypothetical protein